jgi:S1-C subfamily serine protease
VRNGQQDRGIAIAFNTWVSSIVSRVNKSIVLVSVPFSNASCSEVYDFIRSATGFAIDRNVVVTVAHLDPVEKVCFVGVDGGRFCGNVLAIDNRWDIAFIESSELLQPLDISNDIPPIGSIVIASGMPYGLLRPYHAIGIVSGYKVGTFIDGKYVEGLMMLSTPTIPGMSGGPVIDISGNVIGMVVANAMNLNEFALAVPIKRIIYSYRILKNLGKIIHPTLGLKVVEGFSREVRGLTISSIYNKRIIEVCKIDIGDIIISVNNVDIETLEDLWDALDNAVLNNEDILMIKFYDYSDKKVKECSYTLSLAES